MASSLPKECFTRKKALFLRERLRSLNWSLDWMPRSSSQLADGVAKFYFYNLFAFVFNFSLNNMFVRVMLLVPLELLFVMIISF